jgi:hypothetical protein
MDPISALGLATNIIQFIEYAAQLVSGCHDIYRSANGALDSHAALENVAKRLNSLAQDVLGCRPPPTAKQSNAEKRLQEICDECVAVNKKLLELLQKLKVNGPHRKWESFRQIINITMRKKDVTRLEEDLKQIQWSIDSTLLFCLR